MDQEPTGELSMALGEARAGSESAKEKVARAIYGELRKMAGLLMRRERSDHTLQPSALVNEALMRLFDGGLFDQAPNRRYLFAAAARSMRQILINHARDRAAGKRIGERDRVPLDDVLAYYESRSIEVIALNDAVDRLMALNERQGLVVSLRFFAGLSVVEVAEALEVSTATVEADWRLARAWLRHQLQGVEE